MLIDGRLALTTKQAAGRLHFAYMELDYMTSKNLSPPPSLGRALNHATGGVNAMCNAMLAEHDLSLPQWVILSALWRQDGLLVSEIADYTGNGGPAASRIVDRMEDKALVQRQTDTGDRRTVRVFLTPEGRALDHLSTFWSTVNDRLLDGIGAADAERIIPLLERIERNARRGIEGAGSPCA